MGEIKMHKFVVFLLLLHNVYAGSLIDDMHDIPTSTHNADVAEVTNTNFLYESVYQTITHNLFVTAALSVAVSPALLSSSTQSLRISSFCTNQSMATNYTDKVITIGNDTIGNALQRQTKTADDAAAKKAADNAAAKKAADNAATKK